MASQTRPRGTLPASNAIPALLCVLLLLAPVPGWAYNRRGPSWELPPPDAEASQQQLVRMLRERGLNWTAVADPRHPLHEAVTGGAWNLTGLWADLPPSHRVLRPLPGPPPTGKAALAAALTKMAQAKKYKQWLSALQYSGWRSVMEQYIQRVPVTVIACEDSAWLAMPSKFRTQLRTSKQTATKFLQFHMLQQLWPYAALQYWKNTSPYPTFLGPSAWRIGDPRKVLFGNSKTAASSTRGQVIQADVSGLKLRLIVVQGISKCMIPPGVFK